MNSMKSKTLIVTQALAAALLSTAGSFDNTNVDTDVVNDIHNTDGFKITHGHADHGVQTLMVDRIHPNLFSVSFVGHQEFLDMIGTDGWASSADALANYLLEQNPELLIDLSMFSYYEIGDDFVVYALVEEPMLDVNDPSLGPMFLGKVFEGAAVEIGEAIIEGVNACEAAIDEAAASDSTQTAEEAPAAAKPSWKERACKFVRTPMGKVVSGVAITAAAVGAGFVVHSFFGDAAEISVV